MAFEYHKSKLNRRSQICYEQMLSALTRMQTTVECSSSNQQDIKDAHAAVMRDHPELFYTPSAMAGRSGRSGGFFSSGTMILEFNFLFSPSDIARYQAEMERMAESMRALVASCKTEVEKEKCVCDFFLKNLTYEINNEYHQNAAVALVNRKAQCSGFARGAKYLFDKIGMDCIVIGGTARDPNTGSSGPHEWNLIKIDGVYYHLDITSMQSANPTKMPPFTYAFFNESDRQAASCHAWDRLWYPACNNDTPPEHLSGTQSAPTPPRPVPQPPPRPTPNPRPIPQPTPRPTPMPNGMRNNPPSPNPNPAPRPTPFSGGRSTPMPGQTRPTPPPASPRPAAAPKFAGGKTISSFPAFRQEIGKVYDVKGKKLCFNSAIPGKEGYALLEALLQEAISEAGRRNIGVEVKISAADKEVTIDLDWNPKNHIGG